MLNLVYNEELQTHEDESGAVITYRQALPADVEGIVSKHQFDKKGRPVQGGMSAVKREVLTKHITALEGVVVNGEEVVSISQTVGNRPFLDILPSDIAWAWYNLITTGRVGGEEEAEESDPLEVYESTSEPATS